MINDEAIKLIEQILKRGNTAEIKRVKDTIQVIEIQRQLKIKQTITTG